MDNQIQVRDAALIVAIDIGTSYSGYAFQFYDQFKKDPTKIDSPQPGNSGRNNLSSTKTSTCLLLNEGKEIDEYSFGFAAERKYRQLYIQGTNKQYYYFRRFKMLLQDGQSLTKSSMVQDETGKKMLALDVFTLSIKWLKTDLIKRLRKEGTCIGENKDVFKKRGRSIDEKDIFWVLTVPAIWNDNAKHFMREAAIKADIEPDKLEIALEPEAASFFCQHVPVSTWSGRDEVLLFAAAPPGTKYMVVDLGGGTADMTVHEKLDDGRLKELSKASGGPWGGTVVDNAFLQVLINIVGDPVMNLFRIEHTVDYLDLFDEFEAEKRSYDLNGMDIMIKLPPTLDKKCEENLNHGFKKCLGESDYNNEISLWENKLLITSKLLETLFRQATDKIVDHMKSILEIGPVKDISYILMVGGFSESPFVQSVVREAFDDIKEILIIIPKAAGITIAKGAVLYGRLPQIIESRILRFTYGVRTAVPFIEGIHPEEKKFRSDFGLKCNDVFDIILSADSEVKNGFSVEKTYMTSKFFQEVLQFDIFYSTEKTPRFTTDQGCKLLGGLNVNIPNPSKDQHNVYVTFQFGMTELKLSAREQSSKIPCTTKLNMIE